jgi:hypothetical protein
MPRLIAALLMLGALAACGVPQDVPAKQPRSPQASQSTSVEAGKKVVRKKIVRKKRERVLQVSCATVRLWSKAPSAVLRGLEASDVARRGLTPAQRSQQRREALACTRGVP